ncbi:unnamed protein product [Auanema sp. JU1783]|nr:unnamed protein product [Auanema sp. JU1783]
MSLATKFETVHPLHILPFAKDEYPSVITSDEVQSVIMPAFNIVNGINDIEKTATSISPSQFDFSDIFENPQVHIRNRQEVEEKLRTIVSGGREKLLVISDFDFTLSRYKDEEGKMCWTTHGVFDNLANRVDPKLSQIFHDLRDKYFPIEFCDKLTPEEKTPHMEAWWGTSHNHIIKAGFHKEMIEEFVKQANIVLKNGAEELIDNLDKADVPFIVFSAGIGNIIEMYFKHKLGCIPANTHLISNMMLFNDEGIASDFSEPLIHTFCKNSTVIRKDAQFYHDLDNRFNVVLLGDSQGDVHMAIGADKRGPTLKIGYLNDKVEKLLDHYMEIYDIVLVLDPTMDVPNKVLDKVLNNKA